jgi:hypothetical protein
VAASYGGSSSHAPSSGGLVQTVTPPGAPSTTALTSSLPTSTVGQPVTFTATVSGSSGTPTGTVAFIDGNTTLCAAVPLALVGTKAQAKCTTAALVAGAHPIVANYSGSAKHAASSGTLTQTVNAPKATSTTTLTSSLNPSVVGRSVMLTATVKAATGTPTGTVTIVDGAAALCTAPVALVAGVFKATCTTTGLKVGTHQLVARYAGDAKVAESYSATLAQLVKAK